MMDEQDFISFISIKLGVTGQTIRHCLIRLRVIKRYLSENDCELTKQSVERFFYKKRSDGLSNAGLNTYLLCFRYLQAYLLDRGSKTIFLENFKSFPKLRIKPIEILTHKQIDSLLETHLIYKKFHGKDTSVLNDIYSTFTMLLAFTGSRFDEASQLIVKYVNIPHAKITYPASTVKNKITRTLYITEPLVSKLASRIKNKSPEDLVFTNFVGSKIREQEYSLDLKRRGEIIGVKLHPHLLRHTYATHLYMQTRDIGLVQLVLGHRDIKSTMIYVHLADEVIKEGMHSHPFVKEFINPQETIKQIETYLQRLRLDEDTRFNFGKAKLAIANFVISLHGSINNSQNNIF